MTAAACELHKSGKNVLTYINNMLTHINAICLHISEKCCTFVVEKERDNNPIQTTKTTKQ